MSLDRFDLLFAVLIGLGFTAVLTAVAWSPIWVEQYEYSQIKDHDKRIDYVLNEMSCNTIVASSQLENWINPPSEPRIVDGECWEGCEQLEEDYVPEPPHYFIHVPFNDDGYTYFDGLDELVQECKRV